VQQSAFVKHVSFSCRQYDTVPEQVPPTQPPEQHPPVGSAALAVHALPEPRQLPVSA
jgi:hypothetical protein